MDFVSKDIYLKQLEDFIKIYEKYNDNDPKYDPITRAGKATIK